MPEIEEWAIELDGRLGLAWLPIHYYWYNGHNHRQGGVAHTMITEDRALCGQHIGERYERGLLIPLKMRGCKLCAGVNRRQERDARD